MDQLTLLDFALLKAYEIGQVHAEMPRARPRRSTSSKFKCRPKTSSISSRTPSVPHKSVRVLLTRNATADKMVLQKRITALEETLQTILNWVKAKLPDSCGELLDIISMGSEVKKEEEHRTRSPEKEANLPILLDVAGFIEDVQIKVELDQDEEQVLPDNDEFLAAPSPSPLSPGPTSADQHSSNVCTHCSKIFDSSTTLARHLKVFHSSNPAVHICPTCGRAYDNGDSLEEHIATHWPAAAASTDAGSVQPYQYQCKFCIRSFRKPEVLERHTLQHLNKPASEKFPCHICGNLYTDKGTMKAHIREVHKGVRKYACTICTNKYKKSSHLKVHLEAHKRVKKEPKAPKPRKKYPPPAPGSFLCSQCPRVFNFASSLSQHMKIHHSSDGGAHPCPICGKTFKNLKVHMVFHSEERPYKCEYCPKTFKQRLTLGTHTRRHLAAARAEGPVACPICGNILNDEKSVARHVQEVHDCVRNYPCPICPSRFKKSSHLKTHLVAHAKGARARPLGKAGRKVRPGGYRNLVQVDPLDAESSPGGGGGDGDMAEDQKTQPRHSREEGVSPDTKCQQHPTETEPKTENPTPLDSLIS